MAVLTTPRLLLREMTAADLDDMTALLGDEEVMRYYPRPKTRGEAQEWIEWNQRLYRQHGFGLWALVVRATGEFAGDCGLTPQRVDGTNEIEVGYHIRASLQGNGYATEAATARAATARAATARAATARAATARAAIQAMVRLTEQAGRMAIRLTRVPQWGGAGRWPRMRSYPGSSKLWPPPTRMGTTAILERAPEERVDSCERSPVATSGSPSSLGHRWAKCRGPYVSQAWARGAYGRFHREVQSWANWPKTAGGSVAADDRRSFWGSIHKEVGGV